jgi:hypothetical protein
MTTLNHKFFPGRMFRLALTVLVIAVLAFAFPLSAVQAYSGYPTFDVTSVEKDVKITIQTKNLPANQTFTVRMGKIGTRGVGGEVVGTFDSETGGSKSFSFNIPDSLKGQKLIAVRFDSPSGYYAFNWFTNDPGGTSPTPAPSPSTGIPTFSIKTVVKDDEVTIRTNNFPKDMTFTVRMGAYGTKAVGGTVVGTTESGTGGTFEATYKIPDALKGSYRIAIRLDGTAGYFAYNWFYNNTTTGDTGGVPPTTPGYTGIPTFSIKAVVRDDKVTIYTNNFPKDMTFTVRMGAYGTKAVGGTVVGTTDSGAGGAFEATYTVPDGLKGSQRIAIRMDGSAGFFAYNWFWNNTFP